MTEKLKYDCKFVEAAYDSGYDGDEIARTIRDVLNGEHEAGYDLVLVDHIEDN